MRILVLAALLGSGLCAQTPPVNPFEPAPELQAATPVQISNPAALERKQELNRHFVWPPNRRFFSPPTPMIVTPNNKGGQVLPTIIPYVFGRVTLAPGRACSIPLLNVLPRGGFTGDPKIVIPGLQALGNIDHMPLIQGVPTYTRDERLDRMLIPRRGRFALALSLNSCVADTRSGRLSELLPQVGQHPPTSGWP